ncbi:hypothetical protein M3Y99_01816100 [Aphelenchoides fujianensis]|nr:hypothetical protein M3Y99_01816100 [Aphelenchoides fujianensis]
MTLQQNDTLQDASLVQAMLTAVFVNLVSAFVILVDALSFLSSKCSLKYVKTLVASFLAKDKLVDPLKIPHHMAVAFGADEFISVTLLCDLILYAAQDGIRQLSFYDPARAESPKCRPIWRSRGIRTAKRTNLRRYVYFDAAKSTPGTTTTAPRTSSTGLQVCVLSRRHGKEALVNICAELSQTKDEITVEAGPPTAGAAGRLRGGLPGDRSAAQTRCATSRRGPSEWPKSARWPASRSAIVFGPASSTRCSPPSRSGNVVSVIDPPTHLPPLPPPSFSLPSLVKCS